MGSQYQHLIDAALDKSVDVRMSAGLGVKDPICIFGLCDSLGVRVRFVEVSMEGLYVRSKAGIPEILISAKRPIPRRVFTCAHELGHHVFGHGFSVDEMVQRAEEEVGFDPDEFLVDAFAGFLLIPTIGLRRAFTGRGLNHKTASPLELFTIACAFGVGYETLVKHMTYSLRMYTRPELKVLMRHGPKRIRTGVIGFDTNDPLVIVDDHWRLPTIDLEVGSRVLLPNRAIMTGEHLEREDTSAFGMLYRARRPGISRVTREGSDWAAFVRVSKYEFAGLSRYRHLEDEDDE
jgi:hypothetical protein